MSKKREAIVGMLENLDAEDIINVWNSFCKKADMEERHIYENCAENVNMVLSRKEPYDILDSMEDYKKYHDYFVYSGGILVSMDSYMEEIDLDELATAVIRDADLLYNNIDEEFWEEDLRQSFTDFVDTAGLFSKNGKVSVKDVRIMDLLAGDWEALAGL